MALKRRCSLCGERLDSSMRCTACGLDNTKNDSMYKNLINQNDCKDEPLTHVHEEPKVNKNYGKVTYTYKNKVETAKPVVRTVRNTTSKKKKPFTLVRLIVILMILFSTIIPALATIISELSYGIREEIFPEYEFTPEEDFLYEDELNYEYLLGKGYYEIGIHLPEGEYEISMDNSDYAGIGLYEFDGEYWGLTEVWDFAASTGQTVHEVWFEAGDIIEINSKEDLRFTTLWTEGLDFENEIYMDESESYFISGTVVVGEDVPAGVYDFIFMPDSQLESGFVIVEFNNFTEYGGEFPIYFGPESGGGNFFNAPLTPGTVITVDESLSGVHLIPSYVVGPEMYDMTWGAE